MIYGPARTAPWKTVEDVELATLGGVHWRNTIDFMGTSVTFRQRSSKQRSTLDIGPTNPWSKSNSPSLWKTRAFH